MTTTPGRGPYEPTDAEVDAYVADLEDEAIGEEGLLELVATLERWRR